MNEFNMRDCVNHVVDRQPRCRTSVATPLFRLPTRRRRDVPMHDIRYTIVATKSETGSSFRPRHRDGSGVQCAGGDLGLDPTQLRSCVCVETSWFANQINNGITMGPRKGMSLADKRSNILSIFHESKSIYVLKARAESVFEIREFVRPSNPRVFPRPPRPRRPRRVYLCESTELGHVSGGRWGTASFGLFDHGHFRSKVAR